MEMEVITPSSSAESKVKKYPYAGVHANRCINTVSRWVYLLAIVCGCIFCSQRHANEIHAQESPQNGSSSKADHCTLDLQPLYFERHEEVKRTLWCSKCMYVVKSLHWQ